MKKIFYLFLLLIQIVSLISCQKLNKLDNLERESLSLKQLDKFMTDDLFVNSIIYDKSVINSSVSDSYNEKGIALKYSESNKESITYNYYNNNLKRYDQHSLLLDEREITKEDFYKNYLGQLKININELKFKSVNTNVDKVYASKGSNYHYEMKSEFILKNDFNITFKYINKKYELKVNEIYFSITKDKKIRNISLRGIIDNEEVTVSFINDLNLKSKYK